MLFNYFMPTRLIGGAGCVVAQGAAMKALGTKALIVTGTRSAKANGSQDDVIKALTANGQGYVVFDKVMSNPTIQCVYDGVASFRENGCDFVIAIGGGSPMDAGKAMALVATMDILPSEAEIFTAPYTRCYPIVAIPTTAGTGSEVTQYSILTNDLAQTKTSIANPLIFPQLGYLDSAYMKGLSRTVTVNTAIDALSHAVEGMLSVKSSPLSDSVARESIALLSQCFDALKRGEFDDVIRDKLLYASTLAGITIANTGTTAVHALGYSLTYFKDVDHGRANGLLLPSFLAFVEKQNQERIAEILSAMELESVAAFDALLSGLLGEREKLSEEDRALYADKASKAGNIANSLVKPSRDDLYKMLVDSLPA